MAQDNEVTYDCEGCGRKDVEFVMEGKSEDQYFDGEDRIIWEALYRCPHCGQTVISKEIYKFEEEVKVWL